MNPEHEEWLVAQEQACLQETEDIFDRFTRSKWFLPSLFILAVVLVAGVVWTSVPMELVGWK